MKNRELLLPRWKVIADFPGNVFRTGLVLIADNEREINSKYPHLFQKLGWWEEREIGDMPKYVKHIERNEILKVDFSIGRIFHPENTVEIYHVLKYGEMYLPATEEEFLSNKKIISKE